MNEEKWYNFLSSVQNSWMEAKCPNLTSISSVKKNIFTKC